MPGVTSRTTARAIGALEPRLLGLGGVLHLLAHRDLEAFGDQPLQIAVGGMHRHAAHLDVLAQMALAALGERDVECRRGLFGILEEQLVEIAHPVEQKIARVLGLELQIARHRGRRFALPFGASSRSAEWLAIRTPSISPA